METPKKYKARIKGTNKYITGYYFKHLKYVVCPVKFNREKEEDKMLEYMHCIVYDGFADWNLEPPMKVVEIDFDTLEEVYDANRT